MRMETNVTNRIAEVFRAKSGDTLIPRRRRRRHRPRHVWRSFATLTHCLQHPADRSVAAAANHFEVGYILEHCETCAGVESEFYVHMHDPIGGVKVSQHIVARTPTKMRSITHPPADHLWTSRTPDADSACTGTCAVSGRPVGHRFLDSQTPAVGSCPPST